MTGDGQSYDARMQSELGAAVGTVRDVLVDLRPTTAVSRVGHVTSVGDGVAHATGLVRPVAGDLMDVGGVMAVAEEVAVEEIRLVLLGAGRGIQAGDPVRRTGRVLDVPAGPALLGRVVDPLGVPLDGRGEITTRQRVRVEPTPTPLVDREVVSRPLRTGVFAIDTMIPIGRGQRQLVIGDRSTGKTELCLDILAALDREVVGVYVAIGRRGAESAATVDWLRRAGLMDHGFVVVADADDPIGLIHLAPYAATAMAESLAYHGRDVVIVYDDLTSHANAHRTLALLLGRPVGREAHPVDIFYAHARLLERATQLSSARGGGSLTAFPLIETQSGDLTGYIPTNLVSITDGQVRLDSDLAAAGLHPAVDVGLSVSRVGGKAQPVLVRRLAGNFKNRYAQFLELESFARFGTRLESSAQGIVNWGRRVRQALGQPRGTNRSWAGTVALLLIIESEGYADLPVDVIGTQLDELIHRLMAQSGFPREEIDAGRASSDLIVKLRPLAQDVVKAALPAKGNEAHGESA